MSAVTGNDSFPGTGAATKEIILQGWRWILGSERASSPTQIYLLNQTHLSLRVCFLEDDMPFHDLTMSKLLSPRPYASRACKDHGIFYLENHGIPEEMIQQVFDQTKAFFALDVEEKLKLRWNIKKRGYKPVCEELVNQANMSKGGTKEVFEMWRDFDPDSEESRKPLRGPNQWPAESLLPGWKPIMKEYYDSINTLAERVAVMLAVSVGVDPACIEGHFSQSMNDMRLLHYLPEVSDPAQGVYGIGEHTDVGVMTLLVTDEPGLQALVNGEWVDVPSRPGAFICNIADILEIWTNDHVRAPVHRVINKHGRERYTVAVVASPDFNTKVECQPQFCSEDNPAKYPSSTCGIHFLGKFKEIYNITEH